MADVTNKITLELILKELVSGPAAKAQESFAKLGETIKQVNESSVGAIAGAALGLGGSFGFGEAVTKALETAKEAEASNARLSVALGGNIKQFKEINEAAEQVSQKSVFATNALNDVAQRLIERGVEIEKIPQAMQVVADTASALQEPLADVADQVAATFGGTVPRDLGRAVPALKNLSEEALRSGAALDVLSKRYQGVAAAFTSTPTGQEQAALRDIDNAWEDIGKSILPIERTILPAAAKAMALFALPFKADSLVGWLDVLKEVVAEIAGDAVFVADFLTRLLITQPVNYANDALIDLFANLKSLGLAAIEFLVNEFRTELTLIAKDIDGLTEKMSHIPGFGSVKTDLQGFVNTSLSSASLTNATSSANAAADAAHRTFLADQTNPWTSAWNGAANDRKTTIAGVDNLLGAGDGMDDKLKQQQAAAKADEDKSNKQAAQRDAQDEIDALTSFLGVRSRMTKEEREQEAAGDLATLKDQFRQRTISLEDYFARRRALELGATDQQDVTLRKQQVSLIAQAADQKLHGVSATKTLLQLTDITEQLLGLEGQRAKIAAGIDKDERDAKQQREDEADQLTRQLAQRRTRATATIDGNTPAGAQAAGQADLQQLAIEQQSELDELKAKGLAADRLAAVQQVQALETTAKRVETTKQLADSEVQALNEAKEFYQAEVAHNANLQSAGTLTPLQARQLDTAALDEYQKKVEQINAAIKQLLGQGMLSPEQVAQINQQVDTIEERTKEVNTQLQQDAAEMKKSLTDGLAHTLTDIETRAKTVKQAFADLAKSILTDMLNIVNQHIAEQLVGSLFGDDGKGTGEGGAPGTGSVGLLGGLASLFGGNHPAATTAAGANFTAADQAESGLGAPGATSPSVGSGSALGGLENGIGSAFSSIGKDLSSFAGGVGRVAGAVAGGVGQAASGAVSGLGNILGGILGAFASGGYTGDGHPSKPAGIVHAGEYVLNANMVRGMGGPQGVEAALADMGRRMTPGRPASSVSAALGGMYNEGGAFRGVAGSDKAVDALNRAADSLARSAAQSRTPIAAVPVDEDFIRQIHSHPDSARIWAEMARKNPAAIGPAVKQLNNR